MSTYIIDNYFEIYLVYTVVSRIDLISIAVINKVA